jgi:polo-like kinase 1
MIQKRGKLLEIEVQYFVKQMVQALVYLKSEKVLHRDIKPANVFLGHQMNIKLGDFSVAAQIQGESTEIMLCGTPDFIAPEVLKAARTH